MDRQDVVREFESILAEHGLDPADCRESDDWWRFAIAGRDGQAGIHTADFRVLLTICATGTDADLDAMFADLERHNAALTDASFIEADCYIHVQARCALAALTPARTRDLLAACLAAARSPAASSLSARYRSWD
jgi:hypothetical protein